MRIIHLLLYALGQFSGICDVQDTFLNNDIKYNNASEI